MCYLASPLWLLFSCSSVSRSSLQAALHPAGIFHRRLRLFRLWPRIDAERALALFAVTMGVLLAPKLFGLADAGPTDDAAGLRRAASVLAASR